MIEGRAGGRLTDLGITRSAPRGKQQLLRRWAHRPGEVHRIPGWRYVQ